MRALDHIAQMSAYALSCPRVPDDVQPVSLSQNECLRPPTPRVAEALQQAFGQAHLYPDPDWCDLRPVIADLHGINEDQILCGSGSLELIAALACAFAGPGRAVLAPAHAYPYFRTVSLISNARFDTAPETGMCVDVDALLEAQRTDTGLCFLANPANPTGTRIPLSDLVRLRAELREDILLVVDEAYGEFSDHLEASAMGMVSAGNTVVLRTLSKAYGLAGFRIGWGVFPGSVAAELRKVLVPNNISLPSRLAAVEALKDQTYMRQTCTMTATLRKTARQTLVSAGFSVPQSCTNFLAIDLVSQPACQSAADWLEARGIVLRTQSAAGLPEVLRMTIGPAAHTARAVDELMSWKLEHKK